MASSAVVSEFKMKNSFKMFEENYEIGWKGLDRIAEVCLKGLDRTMESVAPESPKKSDPHN